MKKVLLGAHMSIAGGIDKAFYAGASIDCTAIQVFTHSNRQWAIRDLSKDVITASKEAQKKTGIQHVLVHATYLINLGSADAQTVKKSMVALQKELRRCSELGFPYLVLHPNGSMSDRKASMKQISACIDEVFDQTDTSTTILLEIMAGQGNSVGANFDELAL